MTSALKQTDVIEGVTADGLTVEITGSSEPLILKDLVSHWPVVGAAKSSDGEVIDYLKRFYNGRTTIVCKLPPANAGRLFYNEDLTRLDYESVKDRIDETLDAILAGANRDDTPDYYIASNIIDTHFPGFRDENDLTVPRTRHPAASDETVSIWIGSATTATCHFDALDNLACCVAGKRRFTLFAPDQVHNLYPGPLEPTPGGQVISLVDFQNPDLAEFPRFADAMANAQVAELEPGDALFLPSMWWHHVEALAPMNLLINYWWNDAPKYLTSGMNALYTAMMGIRDKPKHEREAWRHLFDYYIFGGSEPANAKLPEQARGFLQPLDEMSARKLRATIINKLNR